MRRPSPRRPSGFTLVELLIVIVIVGILVALLIPAIAGAVRNAQNARVIADINNMAAALEAFKTKYGDYPPSRVVLSESGSYPTGSTATLSGFSGFFLGGNTTGALPAATFGSPDATVGQLAQRSVQYLRKFWPKAAPPNPGGSPATWNDFNGNGVLDPGLIYLEGDECLVFFLGGIPSPTTSGFGMSGFDRNPVHPFTTTLLTAGANMSSENRNPPFFEFQGGRLIDFDGDGIPSYVDTLNSPTSALPFAYFSAYGNNRYDPNDMNLDEDALARTFNPSGYTNGTTSPVPNPYTSDTPGNAAARDRYLNGTSFQIISAGSDGLYGVGGTYNAGGTGDRLPPDGLSADIRLRERDNLSNFSNTKLD
jgi:general secretion pathway protein G